MIERDVEKYFCRKVEEAEGIVRKLTYLGRKGAPDRMVLLPGVVAFVEFKRPGEKPRRDQVQELEALGNMWKHVYVVDSIERADEVFETLNRAGSK